MIKIASTYQPTPVARHIEYFVDDEGKAKTAKPIYIYFRSAQDRDRFIDKYFPDDVCEGHDYEIEPVAAPNQYRIHIYGRLESSGNGTLGFVTLLKYFTNEIEIEGVTQKNFGD